MYMVCRNCWVLWALSSACFFIEASNILYLQREFVLLVVNTHKHKFGFFNARRFIALHFHKRVIFISSIFESLKLKQHMARFTTVYLFLLGSVNLIGFTIWRYSFCSMPPKFIKAQGRLSFCLFQNAVRLKYLMCFSTKGSPCQNVIIACNQFQLIMWHFLSMNELLQ